MATPKRICKVCGRRATLLGRIWVDGESQHVGYFCNKTHRRQGQEAKRQELRAEAEQATAPITCGEWCDRWLAKRGREGKSSSLDTATLALKKFRDEFGDRPLGSITDIEAEDWALTVPTCSVQPVVTAMNYAVKKRAISHNPFVGLCKRTRGRADNDPPTVKELERLRDSCDALGDYAPRMRDLMDFAALTLMRPGELYELRHTDVDLKTNRIVVARRLYRGRVDVPKNGKPKTIALVPPARDILLRQPTRTRTTGSCSFPSGASDCPRRRSVRCGGS